ncbi:matrix metalloproteinase-23-like [Callorhinchus milii]|uniref:matrix metalloproteinase-23-like n=1 Tax=Callorhinchus milii TaxID=7868 RepID=UPI000457293C|nr:matrix metalloproteinase-23-like [Callorhinchus milii]|eukprot:gi/632978501/ref/XP_007905948.1/ PREDICTED: matrix metalloproteinase-23-like [Callorhinchus milii]
MLRWQNAGGLEGRCGVFPCLSLLPLLWTWLLSHDTAEAFPTGRIEVEVSAVPLRKSCQFTPYREELVNSSLIRRKRYIINPMGHKWNHFNITYKIVQFPSTLSKYDTRKGISTAFGIWSNVSPLTFAEVHGRRNADIKLGFYTFEHSDCWSTMLHPCFDGRNGELAHAFLPPVGEIHFDNHDAWILGKARFDRNQGVWLNDLIQVAAHEIGHALGLMHSQNQNSLMHPSITYTGQRDVTQDDISGIQQLYACHDKRRFCGSWARVGFCERRQTFMKDNCPKSCNVC